MHLVWASADYVLAGRPLVGFPIILDANMQTCAAANGFLRSYLLRADIESSKSWEAAGQSLYDYFGFLEAHGLDWRDVDRGEAKSLLSAYRDYCFNIHELARATVKLRMFYVCSFYDHALKQGSISKLPFSYEERLGSEAPGYLAHVNASGGRVKANDAMPRIHKVLPKYLTMDGVKALLGACNNPHHRIIIKFGLQTGLRRMELATFPVAYIKNALKAPGSSRNVLLKLNPNDGHRIKTKRNKARDLWVSRTLLEETNRYITQRRGERALSGADDCGRLFVNQYGAAYSNNGKALEKIVRDIGASVGLEVHPHILRHTYATHTLVALQRSKSTSDPLTFLKNQLGHSSIQTTMIYAHLVDDYVEDAVLQYDDELNEMDPQHG